MKTITHIFLAITFFAAVACKSTDEQPNKKVIIKLTVEEKLALEEVLKEMSKEFPKLFSYEELPTDAQIIYDKHKYNLISLDLLNLKEFHGGIIDNNLPQYRLIKSGLVSDANIYKIV